MSCGGARQSRQPLAIDAELLWRSEVSSLESCRDRDDAVQFVGMGSRTRMLGSRGRRVIRKLAGPSCRGVTRRRRGSRGVSRAWPFR